MAELKLAEHGFYLQDIKTEKITEEQLLQIGNVVGSYEYIFSKVARKYRELKLNEQALSEEQMKEFILQEYTFLKRPVIQVNDMFFVGSAKSTLMMVQKVI
jgi:arsenate reductase (glutaredoxin)